MAQVIRNIALAGDPPHPDRSLDLFLPKGVNQSDRNPNDTNLKPKSSIVAVFVHGGAWVTGHVADFGFFSEALASYGIPTVVAGYRLSRRGPAPSKTMKKTTEVGQEVGSGSGMGGQTSTDHPDAPTGVDATHNANGTDPNAVVHPTHLNDVADAIEWVANESHHHIGVTPESIFLIGHSAGAQLIGLLTRQKRWLTPSTRLLIRGMIGISGIYSIPNLAERFPEYIPWFIEPAFTPDRTVWTNASPMHVEIDYDQTRLSSALIVHASKDTLVNREQSIGYAHLLAKHPHFSVGVDTCYDIDADHDGILKTPELMISIYNFIARVGTSIGVDIQPL